MIFSPRSFFTRAFNVTVIALAAWGITPAAAQDRWPTKPVRIVVPFSAGGSTDLVARMVAQKLATIWGQPVLIENRAGAGGNLGADMVSKSPADGDTILMASGIPPLLVGQYSSRAGTRGKRKFVVTTDSKHKLPIAASRHC